jgi:hypothetical protein
MTPSEELVERLSAMCVLGETECHGLMARLALQIELSEVNIDVAGTAFLQDAFESHGGADPCRKHAGLDLVTEDAFECQVASRQVESHPIVVEVFDFEPGRLDGMTGLAVGALLTQVHVQMTGRACGGGRRELHVQQRRRCVNRFGEWRRDVTLVARECRVLSCEELRKVRVAVACETKRVCGMARLAPGPQLALVDVRVATDARGAQSTKIRNRLWLRTCRSR